jgi:hypothetical protein
MESEMGAAGSALSFQQWRRDRHNPSRSDLHERFQQAFLRIKEESSIELLMAVDANEIAGHAAGL